MTARKISLPTSDGACEVSLIHPQAVSQASATMPTQGQIEQASTLLKLIADPTRLKILSALMSCELCVCDLAVVVSQSESAISHQLRLLRAGQVVASRKVGRVVYYRLLDEHVSVLLGSVLAHAAE